MQSIIPNCTRRCLPIKGFQNTGRNDFTIYGTRYCAGLLTTIMTITTCNDVEPCIEKSVAANVA